MLKMEKGRGKSIQAGEREEQLRSKVADEPSEGGGMQATLEEYETGERGGGGAEGRR